MSIKMVLYPPSWLGLRPSFTTTMANASCTLSSITASTMYRSASPLTKDTLNMVRCYSTTHRTLPHAIQQDERSCGLIAINTIAHNALEQSLWRQDEEEVDRLRWFNRFCRAYDKLVSSCGVLQ
ncbi:hypothetical protein BD626DRAFT_493054 [Schizophyllum amplum]|uniref:Uncharacterized protein n=1 Tax=Schizophyllum amplum TaxID=97359 RepID=A0A550CGF6_9AGAR|nr:hypothetical protein BD626DRAFT_493054 [Auriculariopsis ampla]